MHTSVKAKKKNRKARFGQALMIILLILVISFYYFLLFFSKFQICLTDAYEKGCSNVKIAESHSKDVLRLKSLYDSLDSSTRVSGLKQVALGLEKYGVTQETLDKANELSSARYYYSDADGNLMSPSGSSVPPLDDSQLTQLISGGKLDTDSTYYLSRRCGDGTLIGVWSAEDYPEFLENYLAVDYCSGDTMIFDNESGLISETFGDFININLKTAVFYDLSDIITDGLVDGCEAVELKPSQNEGIDDVIFCVKYTSGENTYIYHESITDMVGNVLQNIAIPFALTLLMTFVAVFSSIKLRNLWKASRLKGKEIRLFKGSVCLDSSLSSALLFVQFCTAVIILALTLYLQLVCGFVSLNSEADANIINMKYMLDSSKSGTADIRQMYENAVLGYADNLKLYLSISGAEDCGSYLTDFSNTINADEVSVFDENGICTHSTSNYVGYKISTSEKDVESQLWDLISGEDKSKIIYLDDSKSLFYCAVRRTDSVGFVRITMSNQRISKILDKLSFESVFSGIAFPGADKFYLMHDNPGELCILKDGSSSITSTSSFSAEDLLEPFNGISMVNNRRYKIISDVFEIDEERQVSAGGMYSLSGQLTSVLDEFIGTVMLYALIILIAFLSSALYSSRSVPAAGGLSLMSSGEIAELQRGILKKVLIACLAVVLALLFGDFLFNSDNSLISFLWSGKWDKSYNLFSFTTVILILIFAFFLSRIISFVLTTISRGLPAKTVTALQLTGSLINVVIFVVAIIQSLVQVGIDAKTIFAGVGVTGIALGIGAKDTINDFIAGLFIIVDGHIHVGDYVELSSSQGKFSGCIERIGFRTTKVRNSFKVISVSNSSMNNVINNSCGDSYVDLVFAVPFSTDIEKLRSAILGNAGRFFSHTGVSSDLRPVFYGITEVLGNGYRCRLKLYCLPEERDEFLSDSYGELKDILAENDLHFLGN